MITQRKDSNRSSTVLFKIIPRAKNNEFVGIMENGAFKVRLTAPPVDGKANHALLTFLSETILIPIYEIEIISGHTSRTKTVSIKGVNFDQIIERLQKSTKTKEK